MRKTTLLWLILAAFCGTALFHTSQKVHDEREKLGSLDVSIGKEQESLRVLNAEWSYLNQPAKLEKLAKTYLGPMAPLKGSQFVKVEDIPLRAAVVAEATPAETPAPVVKIKATRHPALVAGPKSASARHIDSHQTISWMPETSLPTQKHDAKPDKNKTATTAINTRSFTDLMKNLRTGAE